MKDCVCQEMKCGDKLLYVAGGENNGKIYQLFQSVNTFFVAKKEESYLLPLNDFYFDVRDISRGLDTFQMCNDFLVFNHSSFARFAPSIDDSRLYYYQQIDLKRLDIGREYNVSKLNKMQKAIIKATGAGVKINDEVVFIDDIHAAECLVDVNEGKNERSYYTTTSLGYTLSGHWLKYANRYWVYEEYGTSVFRLSGDEIFSHNVEDDCNEINIVAGDGEGNALVCVKRYPDAKDRLIYITVNDLSEYGMEEQRIESIKLDIKELTTQS